MSCWSIHARSLSFGKLFTSRRTSDSHVESWPQGPQIIRIRSIQPGAMARHQGLWPPQSRSRPGACHCRWWARTCGRIDMERLCLLKPQLQLEAWIDELGHTVIFESTFSINLYIVFLIYIYTYIYTYRCIYIRTHGRSIFHFHVHCVVLCTRSRLDQVVSHIVKDGRPR